MVRDGNRVIGLRVSVVPGGSDLVGRGGVTFWCTEPQFEIKPDCYYMTQHYCHLGLKEPGLVCIGPTH